MINLINRLELGKFLDKKYYDNEELSLSESKMPDIYAPEINGYRCTGILDIFDNVDSRVEQAIIYAPISGGTRLYLI